MTHSVKYVPNRWQDSFFIYEKTNFKKVLIATYLIFFKH